MRCNMPVRLLHHLGTLLGVAAVAAWRGLAGVYMAAAGAMYTLPAQGVVTLPSPSCPPPPLWLCLTTNLHLPTGYKLDTPALRVVLTRFDPCRNGALQLTEFLALTLFMRSATATFNAFDASRAGTIKCVCMCLCSNIAANSTLSQVMDVS